MSGDEGELQSQRTGVQIKMGVQNKSNFVAAWEQHGKCYVRC